MTNHKLNEMINGLEKVAIRSLPYQTVLIRSNPYLHYGKPPFISSTHARHVPLRIKPCHTVRIRFTRVAE